MSGQQYQLPATATTDNMGRCSFVFSYPAASNSAYQGTVQVNAGASGIYIATDTAGVQWGTWSGSQPFGPITVQSNLQLTVAATGLLPNTQYVAQFTGVVDYVENLDASMPTSIGSTALSGTDVVFEQRALIVPDTGLVYEYFPTSLFGALRCSITNTGTVPIQLFLLWWSQDTQVAMGSKEYLVAEFGEGGEILNVVTPHLGDMLQFSVITDAAPGECDIALTHTTHPIQAWGGDAIQIFNGTVSGVGNALIKPAFIYAGPAHIEFETGATAWRFALRVENLDGSATEIFVRNNTTTPGGVFAIDMLLPALPIAIEMDNTGAPAGTLCTLSYDLHRVG